MEPYSHDAVTGDKHISYPEAVVLPATTEEVAADGNVHADVLKEDMPQAEWDDKLPKLQESCIPLFTGWAASCRASTVSASDKIP